jgi:hypothetical protein
MQPARWRSPARGRSRPWRPRPASHAAGHEASRPPRPWYGRPPDPAAGHPPGPPGRSHTEWVRPGWLSGSWSRPARARRPPPAAWGPPPAAGRDHPPPASPSPTRPRGHVPLRRPHGRPCRPAGTPQRGPVRSAPPEDGSRLPARSRSAPRRPAHDNARSACASTTPPAGHRPAGHAPAPHGGRGGWPASRNPHSRPSPPSSGRQAATRHPPAPPRRPPSRPGPAATTQTHYPVDPPGASFLQTSDIRKICEVPGLSGLLRHRRECAPPPFMAKSRITQRETRTALPRSPSARQGSGEAGRAHRSASGCYRRRPDGGRPVPRRPRASHSTTRPPSTLAST